MKTYTALFIDVKNSQGYSDEQRYRIQIYMQSFIKILNELFKEDMEHSVVINAGDSMQGLFKNVTTAVMYFRLFELLVHPVQIRAGIGVGQWNIKIDKQDVGMEYISSTLQDGQTYHRARQAIDEVYKKTLHNVRVCSGTDDTFANYLLNASKTMKEDQIYKQNQVLLVMELLYPFVRKSQDWQNKLAVVELLQMKFVYNSDKSHRFEKYAYMIREMCQFENNVGIDDVAVIYEPIIIDSKMKTPEKSILKKNMAEHIAEVLGCSRQNAASIIKSGKANKIREMDYMALQYVEEHYKDVG